MGFTARFVSGCLRRSLTYGVTHRKTVVGDLQFGRTGNEVARCSSGQN